MQFLQVLKIIACVATIITGIPSLIKPDWAYSFIGLEAPGVRGVSEMRAIFGGLLIGIGVAPLLLRTPESYKVVGITYLAIAIARAFSIVFDRSFAQSNIISLVVEIVFGVVLML
jgi:hypothetical protein